MARAIRESQGSSVPAFARRDNATGLGLPQPRAPRLRSAGRIPRSRPWLSTSISQSSCVSAAAVCACAVALPSAAIADKASRQRSPPLLAKNGVDGALPASTRSAASTCASSQWSSQAASRLRSAALLPGSACAPPPAKTQACSIRRSTDSSDSTAWPRSEGRRKSARAGRSPSRMSAAWTQGPQGACSGGSRVPDSAAQNLRAAMIRAVSRLANRLIG